MRMMAASPTPATVSDRPTDSPKGPRASVSAMGDKASGMASGTVDNPIRAEVMP
jgi:hypothetical protein